MYKFFRILLLTIIIFVFNFSFVFSNTEKVKIGLLVPLSGEYKDLGHSIIKSTRMALNDIGTDKIEIYPKDTNLDPNKSLESAIELKNKGIKIFIGPIFYKSLLYLNEVNDVIFLSLTNTTTDLPKNVISSGVNSLSQVNAIKKFLKLNDINKTIFLTPDLDYKIEVTKAIRQSKIKISKKYIYDTKPTNLTKQIEDITNYKIRKQNLADEILRVEKSDKRIINNMINKLSIKEISSIINENNKIPKKVIYDYCLTIKDEK